MKAMIFTEHGGPDVLHLADLPDPVAGPDDIVVDVRAASVNGVDAKVRRGGSIYKANFPHVLGRDFSGIVSALGRHVDDFEVGDEVFGVLDQGHEGTYAEKVVVRANLVARKPPWLDHAAAAAIALVGITALWAIEDTAQLENGHTILIHGGAGGVGGIAIQIAHNIGARVITTASKANHEYLYGLGADLVIDYHSADFALVADPCDAVFDTVGGDIQRRSCSILKPNGKLVWIAQPDMDFHLARSDIVRVRPAVYRDRAHLDRLLDLLSTGAIRTPPIERFALQDAARAHEISEARHLRGKLVLEL